VLNNKFLNNNFNKNKNNNSFMFKNFGKWQYKISKNKLFN